MIAGGGARHRVDLSHEVMVKDNHWQALRSERPRRWPTRWPRRGAGGVTALYVEVESQSSSWSRPARAGATRLLVDNQTPATVRGLGARARGRCAPGIEIEATGGITLDNVRAYAEAGADFVSIGALTHSVRAADLAVEVQAIG